MFRPKGGVFRDSDETNSVIVTKPSSGYDVAFCNSDEMTDNDKTPKRPGRPAKGVAPMDDAQRQQQYRRRKREAAYAAWDDAADGGKLAQHSTSAVLEAMMMAMQQADTATSEPARNMASMSVVDLAQELARRYTPPKRDSDET